jgi:hypothetical protein
MKSCGKNWCLCILCGVSVGCGVGTVEDKVTEDRVDACEEGGEGGGVFRSSTKDVSTGGLSTSYLLPIGQVG